MTAPHAVPVVPSRLATPDEIPARVGPVVELAQAHGWTVRVTYAHGWTVPTSRTPSRLVESVAVRVRRGIFGAYALWIDGRFRWAGSPYRTYTLTQFRDMIESGDE